MTTRRQFLHIGITATAWPLVASATDAAGIESPPATPLLGVVYDTRMEESIAFAKRSAALGLRAHAIDGDMTRLWYDEIYHHWQKRPTALAGLTAHGPLFCFAELARDVGMRVVFRAEHRPTDDGAIAHSFNGPEPMLTAALSACGRPDGLWTEMAEIVARCPSGRCPRGRTAIATAGRTVATVPRDAGPPDAGTLYTWVIAPATCPAEAFRRRRMKG
jgi:hypothetical protein